MDRNPQTDIRRQHSDDAGERDVDKPHRMYEIEEVTYEDGYRHVADRIAEPEALLNRPLVAIKELTHVNDNGMIVPRPAPSSAVHGHRKTENNWTSAVRSTIDKTIDMEQVKNVCKL